MFINGKNNKNGKFKKFKNTKKNKNFKIINIFLKTKIIHQLSSDFKGSIIKVYNL
jgi:hypothetical protein